MFSLTKSKSLNMYQLKVKHNRVGRTNKVWREMKYHNSQAIFQIALFDVLKWKHPQIIS